MKHKFLIVIAMVAASAAGVSAYAAEMLSDGQIAKVLLTINDGEIDAAKMAQDRTKNDDIRTYAATMETQHKENSRTAKGIIKEQKLDDKKSELSKALAAEAKSLNKNLKKTGGDFDKSYATEQVAMHQKALKTLDDELLPNAKNAALKEHLEKTRAAVAEHLDHAKQLQSKFQ